MVRFYVLLSSIGERFFFQKKKAKAKKTMTDIERIMMVERVRTLQGDRDTLYRMINAINKKLKELDEWLTFDELTKNTNKRQEEQNNGSNRHSR